MSDLTSYMVGGDIMEHVVQGVQGGADEASVAGELAGAKVSSAQMWVSLLESLLVVLVILMVFVLGKNTLIILKKFLDGFHLLSQTRTLFYQN